MKMTANTSAGCGLEVRMGEIILFVKTLPATSLSPSPEKIIDRNAPSHVSTRRAWLVHRALGTHARVKLDFPEGAFIPGDILLQKTQQCLGLLRTQIDALEVFDLDMALGLLLQRAEDQEEVPDVDPHLHTVGIVFAVLRVV